MLQRPRSRTGLIGPVAAVVVPWLWFPLRDVLGPVGDVLAILWPVVVVLVVLVVAVLAWRRRWAYLPGIVSLLVVGVLVVLAPWRPQPTGPVDPTGAVRVAAANITGMAGDPAALLADPADVTVVSEDAGPVDARFRAAYRYAVYGGDRDRGGDTHGVGVYSRYPLRVLQVAGPDLPGVRVRVEAPVPFTLYALHVPRPWISDRGFEVTPMEHHRIVEALAAQAAAEPGPVVLAGDLNTTDRSRDYRVLTGVLTDAVRDTWQGPTQVTSWRLLLLRIDHVLVSPGWCGDDPLHVPLPGSDHQAVTATVGPCR
ncbi:endonuclease/exonuclease/phosphatase family protein [Pseudonocardia sp. WMMC193]|uniref:endonuclease/exonuclease/phosphatase family protein n=1 Tax=Pseudonocardia sp. WMMC193 TaxID=2911965 RepID=UPI001F37D121|nr:endonuclease/exonuclease/phosphatase family protein [Pseudonocardia sp. WMMC193]MCF7550060.1 endonuclease/exonuclease/phosphatase family protein [Pseudonocardia sp. WMMC193]